MIIGALLAAIAFYAGLQLVFSSGRAGRLAGNELIRASTLSPLEWRLQRQAQQSWYQRWLRPTALLLAQRLHLRPARIDRRFLLQAGMDADQFDPLELRAVCLMTALAAAGVGCLLAALLTGTFTLVPFLAWLGYVAPVRVLANRRGRRQAAILAELPEFISLVRAFQSAGMPLERTLHVLSGRGKPDSVLRQEFRRALGRYGLGLSIEQALEELAPRTGVDELESFVSALRQSKRAASGLDGALHDQELMARMNQRNRATAEAAAVNTKLLGVLAGIYLPEFVVLIVIPLFWGIMQRAFG